MNTVITIVVLLVIGGFVWNHMRNASSSGGFGRFVDRFGGFGGGGSKDDRRDDELI
jgi:hypothetical protein